MASAPSAGRYRELPDEAEAMYKTIVVVVEALKVIVA